MAIANAGSGCRRIVQCNANTLNTPYKNGLTTGAAGTAYVNMSNANYGTILYVVAGTSRVFLKSKAAGNWGDWSEIVTNNDFENQSIDNTYGLSINVFKLGNDNLKVLKIQGYINTELKAGTKYTIATDAALKSRVSWYHNIFVGGAGTDIVCYLRIDADGNVILTPKTTIASNIAINLMEYYA